MKGEKTVQKNRFSVLIAGTFIVLCVLMWMDEILDLPHYLLGAPPTPTNWLELLLETILIAGVALFIFREIAKRKEVEGELKGSEERYRLILESLTVGVQVLDREFRYLFVNNKLESIAQMPKEKLIGSKMTDLFPGVEETVFFKIYKDVLETGEPRVTSDEFVFEDGRKAWFEMHAYPVPEGILVMVNDITESKSLEQQLLQSQKMEAIGRLAGGVAHDFNNILTVVTGNTELILAELPEDSPYRDRILNIKKAADHATGLTRQLLSFSRKQIISPRILSINKVISDLRRMLQRVIGEDIRLVTHLGESVGNIRIDPGQIEQVLMNLVVNAREAMPEGGIIAIETDQVELDAAYVKTHPYVRPGLYVQISVSDTGVGMGDEVRDKVFEPFFTTKEGGTGLGLSTVYGIVKQNEGSVNVYSEEGIGTTFKIYFSVMKERVDAGPTEVGEVDLPTGSETILMVEDDSDVRNLATEVLTGLGYKVHAFSGAEEALFFIRESEEMIDLLLTDVVMPGLSGVELASAVLEADPSVRVLYMSGYTDNTIAHYGVLDEGIDLLQKPFTISEIAKRVREVLDA